ncbi:MAG TPA: tRNA lysidine(34) synthetase TilS, partial [bacterium]|nr:tRNA lysidine(34) synthetase TilS [bacterium]
MTGRKRIGALAAKVDESARAAGLWEGRAPLLVAVSGGADSVALLELLGEIRTGPEPALTVIHLDHCLRPSSSADARWVERLAGERGYPYFGGRRDCRALAAAAGLSLEDACRRARHEFFRRAARKFSGAPVALAHHADDQAETVLMRFLLGASPSGLAGMLPLRRFPGFTLLRPLLDVTRRDLIGYLRRRGLSWREDESNRDPAFFRNRLRHELLPLLEREYAPGLSLRLVHLARLEADRDAWIGAESRRLGERLAFRRGPVIGLRLAGLAPLPPAVRRFFLRDAAAAAGAGRMDRRAWERLSRLAEGRTRAAAQLPGGVAARVGKGVLWLMPPLPPGAGPVLPLEVPGRVVV